MHTSSEDNISPAFCMQIVEHGFYDTCTGYATVFGLGTRIQGVYNPTVTYSIITTTILQSWIQVHNASHDVL